MNQNQSQMSQSQNNSLLQRKCFRSVLYISFIVLFYQGISNTQLGIISQFTHQNGQGWVGPLSTSLLFLGSGLCSLFNQYIGRFQFKYLIFTGSLGYTLFIGLSVIFLKLGFTTTIQILILLGSFISGCTVSIFYNSMFNYINVCSKIDNQKTKYFGVHMGIIQSANIVGNVISAVLIQPFGQFNYAVIMNVSIFLLSLFFLGIKNYKYDQQHDKHDNIEDQKRQIQNSQIQQSQVPQKISEENQNQRISLLQESQQNHENHEDDDKISKTPFKIVFPFCFSGIMISFIFCQLSVIFYQSFSDIYGKQQLNRITFIAFIIEGVGQFLGGITVIFCQNIITKKLKVSLTYNLISFCFMISMFMVYVASRYQNLTLMNIACFIAGYCDCLGFSLGLSVAGKWKQSGITYFNISQSGTVGITSIMVAFIPFGYVILWSILICILSTIGTIANKKQIDGHDLQDQENNKMSA